MAEASHDAGTKRWYRKAWVIAAASVVAVLLIAGGVLAVVLVRTGNEKSTSSAPTTSAAMAIKNWWTAAQQDFSGLQKAIADEKAARNRADWPAAYDACQRMHETAVDKLAAHLPSPDSELTADLRGAINDAEIASHMCLSAQAGGYVQVADFTTREDQAENQMRAAQDVINRNLTAI